MHVFMKLLTGEDVIGTVHSQSNSDTSAPSLLVTNPYVVSLVRDSEGYECNAHKWMPFAEKVPDEIESYWIPKKIIIVTAKADPDIIDMYKSWIEEDDDETDEEFHGRILESLEPEEEGNLH